VGENLRRKKNMKKRILSLALALSLVLALVPVTLAQVVGDTWGTISWILDTRTGVLTLRGNYQNSPSVGNNGFSPWDSYSSIISEVRAEEGIVSIGNQYFYRHRTLEKVTLPESLRTIGEGSAFNFGTFQGANNLREIVIPAGVTSINGYTFHDCPNLTAVIFRGNAPDFPFANADRFNIRPNNRDYAFENRSDLTIYYPQNARGWSEVINQPHFSIINFVSYDPATQNPPLTTTPTPTPTPSPTPPPSSGSAPSGFQAEAISAGAKLKWNTMTGGVGFRVYRSENANSEGISITDFYITSTEFVDVNVKANTTYFYSVRQVIAEARPFEGIAEQLSPPSSRISVTMLSEILGDDLDPPDDPNAVKKFILMTIDDPNMTVNGVLQEIDPGRGTTPVLLNARTMVPIRAIVEGMGGSVHWNEARREISLAYQKNNVIMTLNQNAFTVNGATQQADVPPTTANGRTIVPIRFAAESLGCAIDWLNSTRQVVIVYY
jgi:hypothetical protein